MSEDESGTTTIRVSFPTKISLEGLKEEFFTKSTSFDNLLFELADFYRANKKTINEKIQALDDGLNSLKQELISAMKVQGKNESLIVELGGKLGNLEKRVEKLEENHGYKVTKK